MSAIGRVRYGRFHCTCTYIVAILLTDEIFIDELLSPSTFRFLQTGADRHCITPEEDEDVDVYTCTHYNHNDFCINIIFYAD